MSSFICSLVLLLLAPLASCHGHHGGTVLVLGATGRTGSLLYKDLKKTSRHEVRALIRSTDKARDILGCDKCDESEGIYLGDITNVTSMIPAFEHVQTVAIATGLSGRGSPTQEVIRSIEFDGIQNAVKALAQETNIQAYGGVSNLRVVLCSSRGTTTPSSGVFGDILFYKLNAEVFLGSIGMTTSIVKPCGLSTQAGQNRTLVTVHDDAPTPTGSQMIPRADVARVMGQLVLEPPTQNLRFDLCSIEGPGTKDLPSLIESAKWKWQQQDDSGKHTHHHHHHSKESRRSLQELISQTMQSVPIRFVPAK